MTDFWVNMPAVSATMNPKKPFPKCKTEEELIEVLSTITVPTLAFGSTGDDISTPEMMIRSLRAVKGSKLVLFEGPNHQEISYKMRKEYAAEIMNFCQIRGLL